MFFGIHFSTDMSRPIIFLGNVGGVASSPQDVRIWCRRRKCAFPLLLLYYKLLVRPARSTIHFRRIMCYFTLIKSILYHQANWGYCPRYMYLLLEPNSIYGIAQWNSILGSLLRYERNCSSSSYLFLFRSRITLSNFKTTLQNSCR